MNCGSLGNDPRARLGNLVLGLLLVACAPLDRSPTPTPTPSPTPTPWPTLAPLITPAANTAIPPLSSGGPQLIEQYRAEVIPGLVSVFPLEGHIDFPMRIEIIVLAGNPDPLVTISTSTGDQLAIANNGGPGQPEVIGQFQFPGDGYYELGLTSLTESGQVGVSVYQLEPALLEGGGSFTSIDEQLLGTIEHPASYHTFRLPLERGQRIDLYAQALTPGLDLVFELYGPNGALLEARDDNIGADPYLWNFIPSRSGTYTVVLRNYDENVGDYALRVMPSQSGGEAVIGSRTELQLIASPRRSTWLTLPGRALDAVRVETRPIDPGVDIQIAFYDPFGNRLTAVNQLGVGQPEQLTLVQFPFDGQYQIEFWSLAQSGLIDYFIQPIRSANIDEGGLIIPGRFGHEGEVVGPGTVFTYLFDAQAGDLIGIDAHATGGTGLDLGFDLYTPDGYLFLSRDDVVGKDPVVDRVELPQSGRYALTIWNYGGTLGPFGLFVTSPEAPATPPSNNG